jgi:hypothetical protein
MPFGRQTHQQSGRLGSESDPELFPEALDASPGKSPQA